MPQVSEPVVLDASALLCLLRQEPGHERVREVLDGSLMSIVNWSEVVAKFDDLGMPATDIDEVLGHLPIRLVPFDRGTARMAGLLRRETKPLGLSFGDRACIALALAEDKVVLSTDRDWATVPRLRSEFVR